MTCSSLFLFASTPSPSEVANNVRLRDSLFRGNRFVLLLSEYSLFHPGLVDLAITESTRVQSWPESP